ncbi:MBL fold metallo-hydrolase [Bowdeniella nasicola]|nr:MBL fold metallo-hydrolase [Bowdeniella nasicola]
MSRFMEIAPRIWVATSRLYQTTATVIVGDDDSCLLIDPAWEGDELAAIAAWLAECGLRVRAGFATHAHYDHVLWHPGFGDAPRYASRRAAAYASEHRDYLRGRLAADFPAELRALAAVLEGVDLYLAGLDALEPYVRQAALVVPGHGAVGTDAAARLAADQHYLAEVLAGREPADARLADPDQRHSYDRLVAIVSER